jgi:hypothetical protein
MKSEVSLWTGDLTSPQTRTRNVTNAGIIIAVMSTGNLDETNSETADWLEELTSEFYAVVSDCLVSKECVRRVARLNFWKVPIQEFVCFLTIYNNRPPSQCHGITASWNYFIWQPWPFLLWNYRKEQKKATFLYVITRPGVLSRAIQSLRFVVWMILYGKTEPKLPWRKDCHVAHN